MKDFIKNICLICVVSLIVTYTIFAFINWELRPILWSIDNRFAMIITTVMVDLIGVGFYTDIYK
jgi:hypothetical protein